MEECLAKKYIAMYDMSGRCLAKGDTVWVYMDTISQKPALFADDGTGWQPEDFGDRLGAVETRRRITLPQDGIRMTPCTIDDHLLDINGHGNNVRLCELAMSLAGVDDSGCSLLRAEFKSQVEAQSTVFPYIKRDYRSNSIGVTVVLCGERMIPKAVFYFSTPK